MIEAIIIIIIIMRNGEVEENKLRGRVIIIFTLLNKRLWKTIVKMTERRKKIGYVTV